MPRLRSSALAPGSFTGPTRTLSIALAALGLVVLLPSVRLGLGHISKLAQPSVGTDDPRPGTDLWSCVERRINVLLASGASVWVASTEVTEMQRLSEVSVPLHRVAGSRSPGVYVMGLGAATGSPQPGDCYGQRLTLTKLP